MILIKNKITRYDNMIKGNKSLLRLVKLNKL